MRAKPAAARKFAGHTVCYSCDPNEWVVYVADNQSLQTLILNYRFTLNNGLMKKIFLIFSIVLMLVVLLGADIRRQKETSLKPEVVKKPCYGYTIIEFGKGIDCDGDTVKLVKVKGGQ